MDHVLPSPTPEAPLAPGQRLPLSERKTFSPEALVEIQGLMGLYPDKLAATLPALYIAQREFGFVSLDAMRAVAQALQVPEGHVFGVATFYTMYQKRPVGRFHIEVCTNLSCALRGGAQLFERLCERLKLLPGEISPDGMWSVSEVECLGSCGSGPCLQVNHGIYDEFVDDARLDAILEACRKGDLPEWGKA